MPNKPTRPARSARRRIALTLLGVLVALAGSAYVVHAASGPDFTLGATPSIQTIGQGQSATYTVNVARSGGLSGSMQLSVTGQPPFSSASLSPSSLSATQTTSTLTVTTSSLTAIGTYTLTITGKAGGITHSTTATLVVVRPDFSLTVTPATRTIGRPGSTTYAVSATRVGGFTGTVHLSATSSALLGVTFSFSNDLTPGHDTSTLTATSNSLVAYGAYTIHIIGTSGLLSHQTSTELIVAPPDFGLSASPSSQTIQQSDSTSYTATVTRLSGFTGAVALSVSGLPSGATASWAPSNTIPSSGTTATLNIDTQLSTPNGAYTLTISGTSGSLSHSAQVTLNVDKTKQFAISGDVPATLYPGTGSRLNLSLTNPQNFDLKITSLTVAVASTDKSGCSASTNFAVDQFSGAYPLTIHPGTTSLSSLVADSSKWPQLRMLDLPSNQDACQGASITLSYGGSATK